MTRRVHYAGEAQTNGVAEHDSPFVGSGSDFAMIFNVRDVADVNISELSIPDAARSQNGKHGHNLRSAPILHRTASAAGLVMRVC